MIDTSEIPTGPHGSIVVGLPSRIAMTLNPVSTLQATLDLLDSTIKDQPDPVLVFYPYCLLGITNTRQPAHADRTTSIRSKQSE